MGKDKDRERLELKSKDEFPKSLAPTEAPAEQAVILLCEKCGRKVGGKDDNFSYGLQKELKHAAAERFGKHQIRTVISSCFDICPKDRVVACVIPVNTAGDTRTRFFELKGESKSKAQTALLDYVEALASRD